ncbi:MAG: N-formylglutamate amidohydrolase [Rhodospirillales bacterium]|nr:N-formylglutamate amidohydrolase [Rhodospirillales bacterium]
MMNADRAELLVAGDPPAFELVNEAGRAPVLLICDHASNAVPRRLEGLGLDEPALARHVAWDIGAGEVTRRLAVLLDARAVLAGYSRLVIDCNRALDDPTSIAGESDGIEVPGNFGLSRADRAARAAACFDPYHAAIASELAGFTAGGVVPAVISIHSFTPVMNGFARPWHVGILWDKDRRLPVPLIAALASDPALVVGDNEPYSAREPAGHSAHTHAAAAGLPHVAIELRQDLIATPEGAGGWAAILAAALQPILAREDLYRIEHAA